MRQSTIGLACVALLIAGCQERAGTASRQTIAYRWVLPEGYVGWVEVRFGRLTAAPLRVEEGYGVIDVPVGGIVETSDRLITGWRMDQFYFRTASGLVKARPCRVTFTRSAAREYRSEFGNISAYCFFGSDDDHAALGHLQDAQGAPLPGMRSR